MTAKEEGKREKQKRGGPRQPVAWVVTVKPKKRRQAAALQIGQGARIVRTWGAGEPKDPR
jgi:hypothetical protein